MKASIFALLLSALILSVGCNKGNQDSASQSVNTEAASTVTEAPAEEAAPAEAAPAEEAAPAAEAAPAESTGEAPAEAAPAGE